MSLIGRVSGGSSETIRPNALDTGLGVLHQAMRADLIMRGDGWERGTRAVLLSNDRLSIEVVLDRGMDIADARVDGVQVAWRSPVSVVGPQYVQNAGFGPHRGFFGGLLTTGGIDHVGLPRTVQADRFRYSPRETVELPLHGRLSGTPAVLRGYGVDDHVAWVEGELRQVAVFGEHLVLRRRVSLEHGASTVVVSDRVENRGYADTPVAILYHVNVGWPVASPGAEITVPGELVWGQHGPRTLGPPDQTQLEAVSAYRVGARPERAQVMSTASGREVGVEVRWDGAKLPTALEWRLTGRAGHYAVGLEPTTLQWDDGEPVSRTLAPEQSLGHTLEIDLIHRRV